MSDNMRRILDASVELIAEKGVRAVSFREVSRRAGVSHQAPYHYYENYQGILRAIAHEGFAGLASKMKRGAEQAGSDPVDRLQEAGIAYVAFALTHVGHFRVMFESSEVDIWDESEPVDEASDAYGVVLALATQCHSDGYATFFPTGEHLARLCWACVHGIATLLVEGAITRGQENAYITEAVITKEVVDGLGELIRCSRGIGARTKN
ncbi:MAG: TetR/AcrR family transcriptional regulator [Myxococcota bacterium]